MDPRLCRCVRRSITVDNWDVEGRITIDLHLSEGRPVIDDEAALFLLLIASTSWSRLAEEQPAYGKPEHERSIY